MAKAERNDIGFAIHAFVRLEWHRLTTGTSWFATKWGIVREAVREFLAQAAYGLPQ